MNNKVVFFMLGFLCIVSAGLAKDLDSSAQKKPSTLVDENLPQEEKDYFLRRWLLAWDKTRDSEYRDLVRHAISIGANPNTRGNDFSPTALLTAVWRNDYDLAQFLLKHGAETEIDTLYRTHFALTLAQDLKMAKLLLSHEAAIPDNILNRSAMEDRSSDFMIFFLERGVHPQANQYFPALSQLAIVCHRYKDNIEEYEKKVRALVAHPKTNLEAKPLHEDHDKTTPIKEAEYAMYWARVSDHEREKEKKCAPCELFIKIVKEEIAYRAQREKQCLQDEQDRRQYDVFAEF